MQGCVSNYIAASFFHMTNFLPEANDKLTLWAVGSGYCSKEEEEEGASNLPVLSVKKKYYLQSGNFDYLGPPQ